MDRPYSRIPGKALRHWFGVAATATCTLYMAEDHLLLVDCNRFGETYKRFAFHDIQAIVVQRTRWRGVRVAFFLSIAAIPAGFMVPWPAFRWLFAIFLAIVLVGTVYDWSRGPMCHCYLRTALQVERLPSLNRLPRAQWFLDSVAPSILAAQQATTPPSSAKDA